MFSFGPIHLRWYGVLFISGFAIGYYLFKFLAPKFKVSLNNIDALLYLALFFSIASARLVHVFFYEWGYYAVHLNEIPLIWEGGLASHGGGLGVLIAVIIWSRWITKSDPAAVLDLFTVPTLLTTVFIRLGNFMNSEILGDPSQLPWAIIFDLRDQTPRHPAMLYEALAYLIAFLVQFRLLMKTDTFKYRWKLTGSFLVLVFVPRFLIEFIKVEQEQNAVNSFLNTGQLLSLPFIVAGVIIWITAKKRTSVPAQGI
jgi:prolipoprotein diacylglyceryl transferase